LEGNNIRGQFSPCKYQQFKTDVNVLKENSSSIQGIVLNEDKCPIKDAVVELFEVTEKGDDCTLIPITHTFTDEYGQFIFGPLTPGKHYILQLTYNNVTLRKVLGLPFECQSPYDNLELSKSKNHHKYEKNDPFHPHNKKHPSWNEMQLLRKYQQWRKHIHY
jgi:hypothetical protein